MRLDPAMGAKVRGDAGREQRQRDGEGAGNPGEVDAAFEQEEVEDAEDQDEDGRLREEGGAAAGGDNRQVQERRSPVGTAARGRIAYEAETGWIGRGRFEN